MRSGSRPGPAASIRDGGGFSVVELLASLVVTGLVTAAVVSVVLSQSEFYRETDDRIYVQQSLRAAGDLFSTELRMAVASDLLAAASDSVSVRFDLWRAAVCRSSPTTGAVTLFVYDSVEGANLPPGFRGYGFSDPYSGAWDNRDSAGISLSAGSGRTACESRGAPAGRGGWRYRTLTGWLRAGAFDSVPDRGAVVTRYGRLTYALEPSTFEEGLAIWRNRQELVAPFRDGAAFSYVMADGTVRARVPAADLPDVRAVRLVATALGPGEDRSGADSELRLGVRLQE